MNKKIQDLVEEAYKKLAGSNLGETYTNSVLTTLAEKASQNGLQPLPSEMPDLVHNLLVDLLHNRIKPTAFYESIRQHFGTPPAEWWMGLEKGDKFLDCNGISRLYNGFVFLDTDCNGTHEARLCSPYTEPTTLEQFMATLTPEQRELTKGLKIEEVKG